MICVKQIVEFMPIVTPRRAGKAGEKDRSDRLHKHKRTEERTKRDRQKRSVVDENNSDSRFLKSNKPNGAREKPRRHDFKRLRSGTDKIEMGIRKSSKRKITHRESMESSDEDPDTEEVVISVKGMPKNRHGEVTQNEKRKQRRCVPSAQDEEGPFYEIAYESH